MSIRGVKCKTRSHFFSFMDVRRRHLLFSWVMGLTRTLYRARELYRGNKDVGALDYSWARASMFSRRCAESSRICMVRRGLETGISFKELRGGGPTT